MPISGAICACVSFACFRTSRGVTGAWTIAGPDQVVAERAHLISKVTFKADDQNLETIEYPVPSPKSTPAVWRRGNAVRDRAGAAGALA
jgi:hypothetical protein